MEQNAFFSALSTSILNSVGQGFVVYVFVRILLKSAPGMSAENKFRFLYYATVLILAGFITSLVGTYNAELASNAVFNSALSTITHYSTQQSPEPSFFQNINYEKWIAGLYFTGILIQASIILAGLYKLQVFNKRSVWTDKVWEDRLETLCKRLNIIKPVKLQLAERIFSPFTAGFIRPVIIFPIAMLNRLTTDQVEAILLHELAHIRRNDYILNIFHKIMETILFFNPFIWLISQLIRQEREYACDDQVMKHTKDSKQYARALLHIAESNLTNSSLGIAASGDKKFNLFHRIKRLKNMNTQANNPKSGLLALLSIGAAFVSLACIIPAETTIPQADAKSNFKKVTPVSFAYDVRSEQPKPKVLAKLPKLKNSLKALPPLSADTDTNRVNEYFKSAEWKKQMEQIQSHAAEMKKHFDSPEWKKQIQDMKVNSEEMKKHFDSPEWKKQMADMKIHADEMKKHFESPEWKKQIADMKINAEQMKSHALAMQKEFDSPEWKKKIEEMKTHSLEMKKQFDSPEWRKKIEEMKLNAEEMKKRVESPEWKKQIEEIKKTAQEMKLEAEKVDEKSVKPTN
ncbi:M56 family metallopeptidase [Daejeonella lutea]|uniref:Signal transducer regulating beta-lactamase production, contains metallopeptidase domain n=1 Tax=Daejeonella lutea TaxID=572036 RepID=A0A1T5AQH1_9SPHI|nr:M56 family metallopeptidase [Daejeonella lutea]SKB37166.1 Signal transducer regulating beta-lactamase production, contains metallopeptidase domain [Daejeonella lutea]